MNLYSSTHPSWFERSATHLGALLSDHLHCERKAAENALAMIRRYPHDEGYVETLGRLAHEETSHIVQVSALLAARGLAPRADTANAYARALFAEVRPRDPQRRLDLLLCAGFIEARSHERLGLLAQGFNARGDSDLGAFYRTLANAEERHAEIFVDLAGRFVSADSLAERQEAIGLREAEIIGNLPHGPRVH
jgi:tRNA-(ms[2]io[6]A)-hydroxylase